MLNKKFTIANYKAILNHVKYYFLSQLIDHLIELLTTTLNIKLTEGILNRKKAQTFTFNHLVQ